MKCWELKRRNEMKETIIEKQSQLDKLKEVKEGERVIVKGGLRLNCKLPVFGSLILEMGLDCSYYEGRVVEARGNSSVVAWENSSVEAWENSVVRIISILSNFKISLFGFSVCFFPHDLKIEIKKTKYAHIQRVKTLGWFERNEVRKTKKVLLYKRVSHDFKTQEGTENETIWKVGTVVTHPNWNPKTNECREGKFHAVSRPYFADEFRSKKDDKYIAIEIKLEDLYEWKDNPGYPYKIGFREGFVKYECNKFGKEI